MRGFVKYLNEEKLPKAAGRFALGRQNFARMLREGELITQPPEEVLKIGLAELRREQKLFAETAAKIDPSRTPIEVFKEIQHDHPTAEGLIPDSRKDLEAIRQFVLDHHIVAIPSEVRPRVEETLPFERASSFASMDSPGPFEARATEAYYYVTPVEAKWSAQEKEDWLCSFNYYTGDVVSIHEVYPGHYVQFLCMKASSAKRLEKTLGSYAYIEGWAHYSEQMLIDEGFGEAAPARGRTGGTEGGEVSAGAIGRGPAAGLPVVRFDSNALPGDVGGTGDEVFRGELLLRREAGARRGEAGDV